jgi:hypothetical protein
MTFVTDFEFFTSGENFGHLKKLFSGHEKHDLGATIFVKKSLNLEDYSVSCVVTSINYNKDLFQGRHIVQGCNNCACWKVYKTGGFVCFSDQSSSACCSSCGLQAED